MGLSIEEQRERIRQQGLISPNHGKIKRLVGQTIQYISRKENKNRNHRALKTELFFKEKNEIKLVGASQKIKGSKVKKIFPETRLSFGKYKGLMAKEIMLLAPYYFTQLSKNKKYRIHHTLVVASNNNTQDKGAIG